MSTLYERLGGGDGIRAIANDLVDADPRNPRIAPRFAASNVRHILYGMKGDVVRV